MNTKQNVGLITVVLCSVLCWNTIADDANPGDLNSKKEDKQEAAKERMTTTAKNAESARIAARKALQSTLDSNFDKFRVGSCSLDRIITVHRINIEMDIKRQLALESVPGIYARHLDTAAMISDLVKTRYEAGVAIKQDLDFAEAHRLTLEYLRMKAESDLARSRAGRR